MDKKLLEFATPRQAEFLEAYWEAGTASGAARILGINEATVRKGIKRAKTNAAKHGYAPNADINHGVMPGFTLNRLSEYKKGEDGVYRWFISDREKDSLLEAMQDFKEGLAEEIKGLHEPVAPPAPNSEDLMACYIVGDHHYSMYAWGKETWGENWDTEIADRVLMNGFEKLCTKATEAHYGVLVNVGDFMHADNSNSETAAGTKVDTDGRMGRAGRLAGKLFRRIIKRMLEVHQEVIIVNAKGNHDPHAAVWINEILWAYYENEPRVKVMDNYAKFVWFEFGNNLIVTHHGDKIKPQRAYETITFNLAEEWGRTKHRFFWTGHIHHKQAQEMGGLKWESWDCLPPPDAWHAGAAFGSSRSMSCVMLHKEFGRDCSFEANIDELR